MRLSGIRLEHKKNTASSQSVPAPIPKTVRIAMQQCAGAACDVLVQKGDKVLVGQKIGDSGKYMSVPVHSSVSGTVTGISELLQVSGRVCKCVDIETDGEQKVIGGIEPPVVSDRESFCDAVRSSGCCGLGGAGFPTHVKFGYDDKKFSVDTLVINAAECEPYLTGDHREMIENTDSIFDGIASIKKYLGTENVFIGIENNKPDAIEKMTKAAAERDSSVKVVALKAKYPQGAEKVIVYNLTGRVVREGKIPADVGVIVINVSTCGFIGDYMKTGMPLVKKRITVSGESVGTPCNVIAPIGISFEELLRFADCDMDKLGKVITGGPMMGIDIFDLTDPVCKTHSAILALPREKKESKNVLISYKTQTNCIRCGRCIQACPVGLMPTELEKAFDRKDRDMLKRLKVSLCMNCGSCSYVCPAKRDLAEKNQLAKALLRT